MGSGYVVTGAVIGAHGIKGELNIKILTDFPERFKKGKTVLVGPKEREEEAESFVIESARDHNKHLILKLKGIDDRNAAEEMDGFLFYAEPKKILEKDRFYIFDIEGLDVFDLNENRIGKVAEVITAPANDIYLVKSESAEYLIPALKIFIKDINIPAKTMHVDMEKLDFEN